MKGLGSSLNLAIFLRKRAETPVEPAHGFKAEGQLGSNVRPAVSSESHFDNNNAFLGA